MWHTYILLCADNTLYTGITTNLERRIHEHNTSPRGAKYTRVRRPVRLVYSQSHPDRSTASSHEAQIKKLSRTEKQTLIQSKDSHA